MYTPTPIGGEPCLPPTSSKGPMPKTKTTTTTPTTIITITISITITIITTIITTLITTLTTTLTTTTLTAALIMATLPNAHEILPNARWTHDNWPLSSEDAPAPTPT
jgi:hypothetical protein